MGRLRVGLLQRSSYRQHRFTLPDRLRRMSYEFDFAAVFAAWPELLRGMLNSLVLSALAMAIGMVVAVGGALGKTSGPRPLRWVIDAYIELIRNTPFLIQIFLIFFGLPAPRL